MKTNFISILLSLSLTALLIVIIDSCSLSVSYDNPNSYIGSKVLDTIPIYQVINYDNDGNEITKLHYYKYKINFMGSDSVTRYLKTINVKIENHYFVPGDTISFEHVLVPIGEKVKKVKTKNKNFVE